MKQGEVMGSSHFREARCLFTGVCKDIINDKIKSFIPKTFLYIFFSSLIFSNLFTSEVDGADRPFTDTSNWGAAGLNVGIRDRCTSSLISLIYQPYTHLPSSPIPTPYFLVKIQLTPNTILPILPS